MRIFVKRTVYIPAWLTIHSRHWEKIPVVTCIHGKTQGNLFGIAQAGYPQGAIFCFGQSRQQHRRQNGDDGDDHQQLNQREAALMGTTFLVFRFAFDFQKFHFNKLVSA